MRPLHRPMFRYGGPIKEGVMSGIREPHANGGRAALVGNPVFPQRGGRALHAEQLSLWPNLIESTKKTLTTNPLKVVNPLGKRAKAINVAKKFWPKVTGWWARNKPTGVPKLRRTDQSLPIGMRGPISGSGITSIPLRSRILPWMRKNPYWTAGGVGVGGQYAKDTLGLVEQIPLQIADVLVRDKYFDQDKWMKENYPEGFTGHIWNKLFGKDKKEDEEKKLTPDQLRIKQLEKLIASQKEPQVPQKSDAEIRQEQIQKYRDIMDIKGMNKEAAYDSLIAASQAINESGDFKGDLRSGKLINQIIQGASKAFDKPKKTKDAIDTLILKGEIEKDLNKDKNAIMDAYRMKQIELADKQLNESLTEKAIKFAGTMKKPYVDQETAIMTIRDQFDVTPNIVLSEKDMEEVKKQDDYKNETDVFTKIVEKQTLGPGYYVMGSSGFVVDEGGNIKQIL